MLYIYIYINKASLTINIVYRNVFYCIDVTFIYIYIYIYIYLYLYIHTYYFLTWYIYI